MVGQIGKTHLWENRKDPKIAKDLLLLIRTERYAEGREGDEVVDTRNQKFVDFMIGLTKEEWKDAAENPPKKPLINDKSEWATKYPKKYKKHLKRQLEESDDDEPEPATKKAKSSVSTSRAVSISRPVDADFREANEMKAELLKSVQDQTVGELVKGEDDQDDLKPLWHVFVRDFLKTPPSLIELLGISNITLATLHRLIDEANAKAKQIGK